MPKKIRFPLPKGDVASGFEKVLDVYRERFKNGEEKGSSFSAYYKGKLVVNIWGGLCDEQVKRPWNEHTMGLAHSVTKFVCAITIAQMVEKGLLNYDDKISAYWPEFAQNGKENITLRTLLSYQAGLAVLEEHFLLSWVRDNPRQLSQVLAKQKPLWKPGTAHGYHPFTMGLYLDQIVQRADTQGRSLSQYYQDEIADPFGIDFYIGTPKHSFHRLARLEPRPSKEIIEKHLAAFTGDPYIFQLSLSQPKDWYSPKILNDPDFASLPIGSSHGAGTAKALAKLASILSTGGQHDGKTLLTPKSVSALQKPLAYGHDLTLSQTAIYGLGTALFPVVEGNEHSYMFGHGGYGGQYCAADSKHQVGWSYLTNYVNPLDDFETNRWRPLLDALYDCIKEQEGSVTERKMFGSMADFEQNVKKTSKTQSKL